MESRHFFLKMAIAASCLSTWMNVVMAAAGNCSSSDVPAAFCQAECKCVGDTWECCRVRKEFLSMTSAERKEFIAVVKEARTKYAVAWTNLLDSHEYNFYGHIHTSYYFLPWHRCFALKFENLLRKVNPCMTVPYFDWSVFSLSAMEATNPIWSNEDGMGHSHTPGKCINGTFDFNTTQLAGNKCIKRSPTKEYYLINKEMVDLIMTVPPEYFELFEMYMRVNLHDMFHCAVGGVMCTISAANDPIFFLHHCFVDKVWSAWQSKSAQHAAAFFPEISLFPKVSGTHPSECLSNDFLPLGAKVCYAETNHSYASQDPANEPRHRINSVLKPLNEEALSLFHVREVVKENADLTSQVMYLREKYRDRFPKRALKSSFKQIDKDIHSDNRSIEKKLLNKNFKKVHPHGAKFSKAHRH